MNGAINVGRLQPSIDHVFLLDEAIGALRNFESARHVGRVVIEHSRALPFRDAVQLGTSAASSLPRSAKAASRRRRQEIAVCVTERTPPYKG
jgi:hypothetical protein